MCLRLLHAHPCINMHTRAGCTHTHYTFICTYICIQAHTRIHMHAEAYTFICTYICIQAHTRVGSAWTHEEVYAFICHMYTSVYTCVYACKEYTFICTYTRIQAHTGADTWRGVNMDMYICIQAHIYAGGHTAKWEALLNCRKFRN
jgi:hypothetical protein